jgi:hypothetical protein
MDATGLTVLTLPDARRSTSHLLELLALHETIEPASTSPRTSRTSIVSVLFGFVLVFVLRSWSVEGDIAQPLGWSAGSHAKSA